MKEVARVGQKAKNNYFSKKPALGGTPVTSVPVTTPTPVTTSPPKPAGGIPEWKRRQLEVEKLEAARKVEEERQKQDKLRNISSFVIEESVLTLSGSTPVSVNTNIVTPVDTVERTTIDTCSIVHSHNVDERMIEKQEEERLMRKTSNSVKSYGQHNQPVAQPQKQVQPTKPAVKACLVTWVDQNTNSTIKEQSFPTIKGRLPIASMRRLWNVQTIIWRDMEEEISVLQDGYSEMSFAGMDFIKVWCY
eukprot:TRINITY_DN2464_c0_g2_i1.p1 TRINITY_DN2464_c0_g2~~TRINITY_DN2464_c0_g2_i1.p1  ORF type:complete len:248 (-),score=58.00 TRINITY_DN2464_c0_g2_i1:120-863(-)